MSDETIRSTLRRRSLEIELESDDEAGTLKRFTMREILGRDRDAFVKKLMEKSTWGPDGKFLGVRDQSGLHADLLSRSLVDESGKRVPESVVEGWPSRMQHALYVRALALNAIEDEAAKDVGNVSAASGSSGSDSPTG